MAWIISGCIELRLIVIGGDEGRLVMGLPPLLAVSFAFLAIIFCLVLIEWYVKISKLLFDYSNSSTS